MGQVTHPNIKNHPQNSCGLVLSLLPTSFPPSLVHLVAQLPQRCLGTGTGCTPRAGTH